MSVVCKHPVHPCSWIAANPTADTVDSAHLYLCKHGISNRGDRVLCLCSLRGECDCLVLATTAANLATPQDATDNSHYLYPLVSRVIDTVARKRELFVVAELFKLHHDNQLFQQSCRTLISKCTHPFTQI